MEKKNMSSQLALTAGKNVCAFTMGVAQGVLSDAANHLRQVATLGQFDHFWPMSVNEAKSLAEETVNLFSFWDNQTKGEGNVLLIDEASTVSPEELQSILQLED